MKKLLVVGLSLLASSQGRFTKENKGVASNFASDSIAHVVPNPPEVSSPHVPISSCEWCKTLVPIIAERIARHHNHHGGNGNDGQMHILPVDEKEEEDGQMHILPIDEKEDGQMHILPVDEEEEEKEETEDDGQMHILPVDKMEETGDDGQMHILPVEEEKEEEDDGQMHILPYAENTGLHAGVVQDEEEMVNAVQSDQFRRLPSRRGPHEGRHKGKHGGKHGEKARFEICKRFDQSKECHDFLSMYGKIIAKKIMNGEQNICESLIDIIQNKDNARMCDNQNPWTAIGNGESDVSFDIFFSLLKEMSSIRPADSEVVQTTQIVQDQNGNVWQKTETFYSNSESGAWIDVVKIEQIDEPVNGGELLIHEPQQQCIFSRIKNAIVREFRNHRTFYVSFFLTFVSLYCVFSVCCKRKKCNHHECQMRQQQMEASFPEKSPLEKTPPPPAYENYPGNVYVQIGLVSPSKEKVIQRPI